MNTRLILAVIVALLSVGWLYPMWLAMWETLSYSQDIGERLIGRGANQITDKEILVGPVFIGINREIAFIWAAVAGLAWSFVLAYRLFDVSKPTGRK